MAIKKFNEGLEKKKEELDSKKVDSNDGKLSDDELAAVAGGEDWESMQCKCGEWFVLIPYKYGPEPYCTKCKKHLGEIYKGYY